MRARDVGWFGNAVQTLWQVGWALYKDVADFFLTVFVALSRGPVVKSFGASGGTVQVWEAHNSDPRAHVLKRIPVDDCIKLI